MWLNQRLELLVFFPQNRDDFDGKAKSCNLNFSHKTAIPLCFIICHRSSNVEFNKHQSRKVNFTAKWIRVDKEKNVFRSPSNQQTSGICLCSVILRLQMQDTSSDAWLLNRSMQAMCIIKITSRMGKNILSFITIAGCTVVQFFIY